MRKILKQKFFDRPVLKVAEDLLGKYLVRKVGNSSSTKATAGKKEIALIITEVEAYDGPLDRACHAHKGRTARTEVMFGEAGRFYVYLIYGMYSMLNIVTGKKDYPAAILIRGVEGFNGPGKLTTFLKIDKKLNCKKAERSSNLWFEDRGVKISKKDIKRTPRIGVTYAGLVWSKKPYRFILKIY